MKLQQRIIMIAALAFLVLLGACAPQATREPAVEAPAVTLDRQSLVALMHQYLAALAQNDPSAVPFAENVKFVENTANIPVGDGLWATAVGGPGEFLIMAADPTAQQVACLVMMKENRNADVLLGARIKVENGMITEAEHLAVRDMDFTTPMGKSQLNNLQRPRPALLEDITPEERTPYDQMVRIGLSYYDALLGEDGTLSPFAPDCERRENGMTTAGTRETIGAPPGSDEATTKAMMAFPRTCAEQISTGTFAYITDIKSRRVPVVDEQNG
ncbi:MAG TPA: hypothetical protein VLL97_02155, partial [Acidobacteriota bacterium]|nr:hypothetical protein [Acidobacteriota bacterium]